MYKRLMDKLTYQMQSIGEFFTPHRHEAAVEQDGVFFDFTRTGIQNVWRGGWFEDTIIKYDGFWTKYTGHQDFCTCGKQMIFCYEKSEKITNDELIQALSVAGGRKVFTGIKRVKNQINGEQAVNFLNQIQGTKWKLKKA